MSFEAVKRKIAEGIVDECCVKMERTKKEGCKCCCGLGVIETSHMTKGKTLPWTWTIKHLFSRWQLLYGWLVMNTLRRSTPSPSLGG